MHKRHPNNISFILFIPFVVLIGMFILANSMFKSGKIAQQRSCVLSPDATKSIKFSGQEYYQILTPVQFSAEAFNDAYVGNKGIDWHFRKVATVNGRDYWRPLRLCEGWGQSRGLKCTDPGGEDPAPINWQKDPAAMDLLFVDYSKDNESTNNSIKYMAVYLKEGKSIPSFIRQFCAAGMPYRPLDYSADMAQKQGVPYTVDSDKIAYVPNPAYQYSPGTYTLFMYEDKTQRHDQLPVVGNYSVVKADGTTKRYEVTVASFAFYLELYSPGDQYAYLYSKNVTPVNLPTSAITSHQNLQLETFYPVQIGAWGWWEPECKPAIYLYPKQTTAAHVTIDPAGYLTYTDPLYPPDGWRVTAHPDGTIVANGKQYPYLYYESKIRDSAIQKPAKGYVVTPEELPALFSNILPKLGLSEKETRDFKEYWENKLTQANYYFVGVMENKAIDAIEPLTIEPKADTIIRVRLYFEALDMKRPVEVPILTTPHRKGFIVAEWGGLVKADKNHPFTCSQ